LLAGLRCIEDIAKSKNALLKFDIWTSFVDFQQEQYPEEMQMNDLRKNG
jgi:hypothetical protein